MIEIYLNTNEKLELRVYSDGVVTAADALPEITLHDIEAGTDVVTGATTTQESDGDGIYYSFITDINESQTVRTLKATWSYTLGGVNAENVDYVDYVQPYVTPDTIRSIYPSLDDKTFDELKEMERTVRKAIEFYTGQTFAPLGRKKKLVLGRGADVLQLPQRIYKLHHVKQENVDEALFSRDSDGAIDVETVHWHEGEHVLVRKTARQFPFDVQAAVSDVLGQLQIFKNRRYYEVDAEWGWSYVPNEVNQAAKLLIGDYFCSDSNYHFRGVDVVRSSDWRMEFAHDPYSTTGNVVADQLLAKYINQGVVVL